MEFEKTIPKMKELASFNQTGSLLLKIGYFIE
jgi:hypothetical protein